MDMNERDEWNFFIVSKRRRMRRRRIEDGVEDSWRTKRMNGFDVVVVVVY